MNGRTPTPAPPFPEAVSRLPLFGYTVYVVLRVSQLALPGPSLLGLNRQHLILLDPFNQVGWDPAPVLVRAPLRHCPIPHGDPSVERGQALLSLLPQKPCCSIALKDLHQLHLLSPLEKKGAPGLELNYGSADRPRTIWFELPKVSGRGL